VPLPKNAFEEFLGMGDGRSYGKLAARFGVCKRTVTRRAKREQWQARLLSIRRKAAERVDEEAVESLAVVHRRHLRVLKAVQAKALKTLQQMPLTNTGEAIRALLASLAQEREILGPAGGGGGVVIQVVTGVPRPEEGAILDAEAEVRDVPAAGRFPVRGGGGVVKGLQGRLR
jgi:hypothetical protein